MDCNDISGVIGDAINPMVAIDLAGGDYSIKLYPDVEDLVDMFSEVINYTKWRDFLLIYDGDNGKNNMFGIGTLACKVGIILLSLIHEVIVIM